MRKIKWLIILLIIALAIAAFDLWLMEHRHYQRNYPTDGIYYCEELDIQLTFSFPQLTATYPNRESITIHADWGNGFQSEDNECQFLAQFSWNQKKNILTLKFLKLPFDFDPDVKYIFVCIG